MSDNFLASCESEKLHLSGQIQPHGGLLVSDLAGVITHVSDNIDQFCEAAAELQPGKRLPQGLLALLEQASQNEGMHHFMLLEHSQHGQEIELTITHTAQAYMLEFYRVSAQEACRPAPKAPSIFNNETEVAAYRHKLLQWIADLTQHDRAMYYQFIMDGDGVVTAEVCQPHVAGTYLDLRFPASDIPNIARNLYVKNPWRMIPDAQATPSAILGDGQYPDLSYVDLRSVSPVHQVYMKNMGVGASISFPIVRAGELDALISCHSGAAKSVSRNVLQIISAAIGHYSSLLREYDVRQRMQFIDEFNFKHERLRTLLNSSDLEQDWPVLAKELVQNFAAESVALCTDEGIYIYQSAVDGYAITDEQYAADWLHHVDQWFCNEHDELIFHTDHFSAVFPEAELTQVAGVCGLRFRSTAYKGQFVRLYLTRSEFIYEVKWGGNPNKPVENHDGEYGISPRRSFAKWVERRLGYSKPWPSMVKLELHRLRSLLEKSALFTGRA